MAGEIKSMTDQTWHSNLDFEWICNKSQEWESYRYGRPFLVNAHSVSILVSFAPDDTNNSRISLIEGAFSNSIMPGGNISKPYFVKTKKGWLCIEKYYPSLLEGYNAQAFSLLSISQQSRILLSAANALHTLHNAGLVHGGLDNNSFRMIKASDNNFRTVLSGFAYTDIEEIHATGYPAGYQASEIHNRKAITKKTDVYALGVCFYFLLTNRIPSWSQDGKLLVPSFVDDQYRSLLSAMLKRNPEERVDMMHIISRLKNKGESESSDCIIYYSDRGYQINGREYYNNLLEHNDWLKNTMM